MPCGRENRSAAAAAVSAWPLRQLVLVVFLFSVMPHGALSWGLPQPREGNVTCNHIPYPFGVKGKALLPNFEVTCGQNNESMLRIDGNSYKIDDVSVEGAFVVILAGPISQVCYDRNGKRTQTTGIGNISLQGTPFSFSNRNKLVATGCNYRLVGKFSDLSLSVDEATTCYAYCDETTDTVDCLHGIACCSAPMPMLMNTPGEFTFKFDKIEEQDTVKENGTCSAALFLAQGEEVFMGARGGVQRPLPLKDMLLPAGDHRMILDWAVGHDTCLTPLHCNNMSECIEAPRGAAGYLCKCNPGYEGNPYAAGGCVGLNVCAHLEKNPCTYADHCSNWQGAVSCECPPEMSGDGWKTGSGCRKHFPLHIVLGNLTHRAYQI